MITLNQTKNYLQIANSGYDSFLSEIIAYSIAHIENYVGYTLSETEETNIFQGTGRQWLSIPRPNITEISEVKIDDVVVGSTLYSIKNNMVFKKDLWEKSYIIQEGMRLVDYNVEATYTYGFTYPLISNPVNDGTVPKELQYVALEIAKKMFINSGTQQQIKSEGGSHMEAKFNYDYYEIKFGEDLPKELKKILNKYKR